MEFLLQVATNWILPALFFLFVLSFCTMIFVQLLDSTLHWRSKFLREGLTRILGDELEAKFWKNALANPLSEEVTPPEMPEYIFASIITRWVTVGVPLNKDGENALDTENEKQEDSKPAQLGDTFSVAEIRQKISSLSKSAPNLVCLLDIASDEALLRSGMDSDYLINLRQNIANWFGCVLNQIGRRYKGFVQKALFGLGLIVAVLANFDVIGMVAALWKNALIKELVDLSEKAGQTVPIDVSLFTSLPIGWQPSTLDQITSPLALILKIAGIILGGFLIFVTAQYIYDFVERKRYAPAQKA